MKTIETPYGRKTPKLLCESMDAYERQAELLDLLKRAVARIEDANQRGDMILNAWQQEAKAAIAKAERTEGE